MVVYLLVGCVCHFCVHPGIDIGQHGSRNIFKTPRTDLMAAEYDCAPCHTTVHNCHGAAVQVELPGKLTN